MLLLDTHALVFLASDQESLSEAAVESISNNSEGLSYSSISALEISLLVKRNRLELPVPPVEFIERAESSHGLRELPVTGNIACFSADLPDIHNDPFDRIIIATAQIHNFPVLSMDTKFRKYPDLAVIW